MDETTKAMQMVTAAPAMTAAELADINATFPAYLFRVRRTREIWTTCCGRHEVIQKSEYTDAEYAVLEAEHHAEPKPYGTHMCHCGYMSAPAPKRAPELVACPYCGILAKVKELGRTGDRKNLATYRRAVVFRWYRGALWALAYETWKKYGCEGVLTVPPECSLHKIYRFKPGEASYVHRWWSGTPWNGPEKMTAKDPNFPKPICEPFSWCSESGMSYDIIRAEEINKSPFRWCGFAEYVKHTSTAMRFLALCTVYPRQVEMLMKAGMWRPVMERVEAGKKNAAAFSWEAANPLKAFDLSKQELKVFLAGSRDLDILAKYKQFRRANVPCSFDVLYALRGELRGDTFRRVMAKLKKYKLPPERWENYMEQVRYEDLGQKKHPRDFFHMAEWWHDYVDAAVVLGLDLKNPIFLTPKNLKKKHDEATKAALPILNAMHDAKNERQGRERCRALTKRYTYWTDRWLIRPPIGAREIVAEGKALKHCVGGYADRHVRGAATILFLRDRKDSRKPLVTIEMRGDQIVQIHGWDDDRTTCKANPKRIPPRTLYAEILDPWLDWVAAGSKRNKDGRPKQARRKKEESAA